MSSRLEPQPRPLQYDRPPWKVQARVLAGWVLAFLGSWAVVFGLIALVLWWVLGIDLIDIVRRRYL